MKMDNLLYLAAGAAAAWFFLRRPRATTAPITEVPPALPTEVPALPFVPKQEFWSVGGVAAMPKGRRHMCNYYA